RRVDGGDDRAMKCAETRLASLRGGDEPGRMPNGPCPRTDNTMHASLNQYAAAVNASTWRTH
nr:hypothetical protein [bacterium]